MTQPAEEPLLDVDAFDLPEWLGTEDVVWSSESGLRSTHHVRGSLRGGEHSLACDLVAVDEAFPKPVLGPAGRTAVHQSWRHGQVALATYDGRLALLVPGARLDPDRAMEAVERLARAVGADPDRWGVLLRIGRVPT